jgi:hypothetical protein
MAEELPENLGNAADPVSPSGGMADTQPRRRRISRTWIVLLPILAGAIALLASDIFRGRLPQNAAYQLVKGKLDLQQTDDSGDSDELDSGTGGRRRGNSQKPLTAEGVHHLLGREPDSVEKRSGNISGKSNPDVQMEPTVVETYKFPGILKSYALVVTYVETPGGENTPATTALQFVRKQ